MLTKCGGLAWQRGACMAKGGHTWQGGNVWRGACKAGACVAGKMATAVRRNASYWNVILVRQDFYAKTCIGNGRNWIRPCDHLPLPLPLPSKLRPTIIDTIKVEVHSDASLNGGTKVTSTSIIILR